VPRSLGPGFKIKPGVRGLNANTHGITLLEFLGLLISVPLGEPHVLWCAFKLDPVSRNRYRAPGGFLADGANLFIKAADDVDVLGNIPALAFLPLG
jgi:hypothetical protein